MIFIPVSLPLLQQIRCICTVHKDFCKIPAVIHNLTFKMQISLDELLIVYCPNTNSKLNMKIKTKYDRWSWLLNINFSVIHPVMTNQCEVWWPFSLEKTENWSQILPDFKIWLLFSGQMFGIMIKKIRLSRFYILAIRCETI